MSELFSKRLRAMSGLLHRENPMRGSYPEVRRISRKPLLIAITLGFLLMFGFGLIAYTKRPHKPVMAQAMKVAKHSSPNGVVLQVQVIPITRKGDFLVQVAFNHRGTTRLYTLSSEHRQQLLTPLSDYRGISHD